MVSGVLPEGQLLWNDTNFGMMRLVVVIHMQHG